jgi:mRNA interferase MazF
VGVVNRPAVVTGEVWLANLDPTVGSEIQKTRPCVVVSPPEMHDFLRTVIVAPMTTGAQAAAFRIPLTFQGKTGLVLLDQVRTLDKLRLVTRVGVIHPTTMHKVLSTLQAVFAPV